MLRLASSAAILLAVVADTCVFTRNADSCPYEGGYCDEKALCSSGLYCKISKYGEASYSGKCAKGPKIDEQYQKVCDAANEKTMCQFDNPLALTPYSVSSLQCVKASVSSTVGQCLLGPQKHGDGCSQEQECASGNCLKEVRFCKGVDEGEDCTIGFPDPCQPEHYCKVEPASMTGGTCAKSVNTGKVCREPSACTRGTFCSGPDPTFKTGAICLEPFKVPTGSATTIGPYMCASGNAVMITKGSSLANSVYQCVEANSTRVGVECDSKSRLPVQAGYECKCAEDGKNRLRTVMALGLGGRATAFKELYTCLLSAQGPTGDPCQFDSLDLEQVRYGSCGFYACYPYYLKLVNVTGGRTFAAPLSQFEPTATCEAAAAASFYQSVDKTPCITIPHLDNWKCASLALPRSLSVSNTWGVIVTIFVIMLGFYYLHMWYFRKLNHTKWLGKPQ